MLMRITMAAAALAALSSCGQGGGYPDSSRQAFLTSCKGSGAPGQLCDCALKKFEEKMPYAEFTAWDAALQKGEDHPASAKATTIMGECASELAKTLSQ